MNPGGSVACRGSLAPGFVVTSFDGSVICDGDSDQGGQCGDGIVETGEECDCGDGTIPVPGGCPGPNNDNTYGGCTTRCTWGTFCGDGVVSGPEQCDLGKLNGSDLGPNGCTFGCLKPHYCGDDIVDTNLGEQCDLGTLNGMCLDGQKNPVGCLENAGCSFSACCSCPAGTVVFCDTTCSIPWVAP